MTNFPLTIESNAFLGGWIEDLPSKQIISTNLGAEIYLKSHRCSKLLFNWPSHVLGKQPSRILFSIDGGPFISQSLDSDYFQLDLDAACDHLIRIMTQAITFVRAESWSLAEIFTLKGIQYDGSLVGAVPDRAELVFIGDSIINGQKTLAGVVDGSAHRPDKSWDFLISEKLQLNNDRIAYGGSGLTQRAKICPPTAIDFIWYAALNLPRPIDHQAKIAAVIVNLGSNDAAASEQEFTFSLKVLLRELTKRFHDSKIIFVEPFNGNFAAVFRKVIPNNDRVTLISNHDWHFQRTDAVHLSVAGHEQAAKVLLPLIEDCLHA
ncbi:lysophospholipase [Oenococcus sicerae]|uniref:Lysophospholipase n=1 Tax=Oenococcus sicerae TaxID=2203724 RepID=A0AAJ1R813_9LACO|nr:lysophospholipase [Oenococcus sicerae]MDN6899834.1 lysophospholipase [Oenococcus sicerae]QAS70519.1 lysophospholipase [Oenococcus sicerae]